MNATVATACVETRSGAAAGCASAAGLSGSSADQATTTANQHPAAATDHTATTDERSTASARTEAADTAGGRRSGRTGGSIACRVAHGLAAGSDG